MKVLHYEHNGAGVILSAGLKKIGVSSVVVSTAHHPYGFEEDRLIKGPYDLLQFDDFDILHSHSHLRLPPKIVEHFAGRLVQHYHDATIGRIGRLDELKAVFLGESKTGRIDGLKTVFFGKKDFNLYSAAKNFVSTPNIIKFIRNPTWVPLPVDTEEFYPARLPDEPLTIGFNASSLDTFKIRFLVARQVVNAANRLRSKGVHVVLKPQPTNINHNLMHGAYWNHIDVWVDRFGLDFYGFSSVEAAACGIPVVCQIGDKESAFVRKCPFINTTASELIDVLVETDFVDKKLKKAHRDFAVEVHDFAKVAALCKRKYEELL